MEQINLLLKNTLNTRVIQEDNPDVYVDFLNLACLLAGVRNGVHLDTIVDNEELIYNLTTELKGLGYDFNTRYETTIWNTAKITRAQVLHSWAYKGDTVNLNDSEYWANNALLLGNTAGYPTFTMDPVKRGSWSLKLTMNYDGETCYPISMMGGFYDKSKEDDLRSIKIIKAFLESLVGFGLYNPHEARVVLETVELEVK